MKKYSVPAAPQPSFGNAPANLNPTNLQQPAPQRTASSSKTVAPLDAAFLRRTYRTCAWMGPLLTLCAYAISSGSFIVTGSFAAGALLAALLLKSQEIFVRRVLRPKGSTAYAGWDKRIPLPLLLFLKYSLIAAAMCFLLRAQVITPAGFATGFMMMQLVVVARAMGRLLSRSMRPIGEVYVRGNKSHVQ